VAAIAARASTVSRPPGLTTKDEPPLGRPAKRAHAAHSARTPAPRRRRRCDGLGSEATARGGSPRVLDATRSDGARAVPHRSRLLHWVRRLDLHRHRHARDRGCSGASAARSTGWLSVEWVEHSSTSTTRRDGRRARRQHGQHGHGLARSSSVSRRAPPDRRPAELGRIDAEVPRSRQPCLRPKASSVARADPSRPCRCSARRRSRAASPRRRRPSDRFSRGTRQRRSRRRPSGPRSRPSSAARMCSFSRCPPLGSPQIALVTQQPAGRATRRT
jgi:hypothetical protein